MGPQKIWCSCPLHAWNRGTTSNKTYQVQKKGLENRMGCMLADRAENRTQLPVSCIDTNAWKWRSTSFPAPLMPHSRPSASYSGESGSQNHRASGSRTWPQACSNPALPGYGIDPQKSGLHQDEVMAMPQDAAAWRRIADEFEKMELAPLSWCHKWEA